MAEKKYTRSGPGKFEGEDAITEFLFDLSLEGGPDEQLGEVGGFGWYGLMTDVEVKDVEGYEDGEIIHAILHENDQGFVGSTLYDTEEEALGAWGELEDEYEEWEAEAESEES